VVEETLSGRSGDIKGFTIATKVFGRKENFDPYHDPIVRIEAGRLRRALERYYLSSGKDDPVFINIPKGTYVPTFTGKTPSESATSRTIKIQKISLDNQWPSLVIQPFQNLTGDSAKNSLSVSLANELALEIIRFQEVRVLLYGQENQKTNLRRNAFRFILDGDIREDISGIKVTLYLRDTETNVCIWGDTYQSDVESSLSIKWHEKIAYSVAAKIAGEHGVLARTLYNKASNKHSSTLTAYEAILCFYEHEQRQTPETFMRALEALEHASVNNPNCGQIWTMLGRLYGMIYALELPGFETAKDKAVRYAERGVQLDPENQRSRSILAYIRMLCDEITAAREEIERAYAMNPNSLFILDGIAYVMTLLGEWERGPALIRRAIERNPYYKPVVHYALWLDYFRQEKYPEAHLETLHLRMPTFFWESLVKATTYAHLGKYKEGKQAVNELLKYKPDFPSRGRTLIKHYIKFDDIVDRVIKGLHKVGLNIQ
jgi:adenylate cyclase